MNKPELDDKKGEKEQNSDGERMERRDNRQRQRETETERDTETQRERGYRGTFVSLCVNVLIERDDSVERETMKMQSHSSPFYSDLIFCCFHPPKLSFLLF